MHVTLKYCIMYRTDGGEDEVPTSSVDNQQKKEEKDAQIKSKKGKKGKKTSKDDEWYVKSSYEILLSSKLHNENGVPFRTQKF